MSVRTHDTVDAAAEPPRPARPLRDRFNSPTQAIARFLAQRSLLKPVVWSITRVTVIGKEQLAGISGGYVAVANHSSHLDTPLIVGSLPRPMARYLAAGAAADYFFSVWWRRGLTALFFNAFPIRRSASTPRPISPKTLLSRGIPLLIFPEGTRSKDGELGPFKPGAAALAIACDVPCIPIAVIGAHQAHPRGTNWPRRGRQPVAVVYGQPLRRLADETSELLTERLRKEILRLRELHSAEILSQTSPRGAHK
ncbi:MAG: 1-acyl-sn-glycerol-3-phosphate acyltransferase [Microbacteriaceae bacterium]|nr:1-acyl-sn-glycerol-3-phosphate acyltransferase [Microbacteriaceae bacterium]